MLQNILVALIVLLALLHTCRRYLPAALRRRWATALSRRGYDARLLSRVFGLRDGCGDGCSSCGACDSGPSAGKDGAGGGGGAGNGTHASTNASFGASTGKGPSQARVIRLHVQR